jgi:hypothetical protein
MASYDILYSLRGDKFIARHLKTVTTVEQAVALVRDVTNLPTGTIHYAITCDDGRTIHDSSHDGLLKITE